LGLATSRTGRLELFAPSLQLADAEHEGAVYDLEQERAIAPSVKLHAEKVGDVVSHQNFTMKWAAT
jgi:hypothetical protein